MCSYNVYIPTHFANDTSSCIDIVFSSDTSLTKNYIIEQPSYRKCHHHILVATLRLSIPYPPSYYIEIWNFICSEINSI